MYYLKLEKLRNLGVKNFSSLRSATNAVASFTRIFFCAALPMPTIKAVGVASPMAHGQAMTKTETDERIKKLNEKIHREKN